MAKKVLGSFLYAFSGLCGVNSVSALTTSLSLMSTRSQSEFPPWMTQKKAKTDSPKREDPLLFHQEIMGFVRYIKLNSEEKEQRIAVVESLSKVITKLYPQARVRRQTPFRKFVLRLSMDAFSIHLACEGS